MNNNEIKVESQEKTNIFELNGLLVKHCNKCNETKEIKYFGKHTGKIDNLEDNCKVCRNEYIRNYFKNNKEQRKLTNKKAKEKLKKNPDYIKQKREKANIYNATPKGIESQKRRLERIRLKLKNNESFRLKERERKRKYRNDPINKEKRKINSSERYKKDLNYKFLIVLRNRMTHIIANRKAASTIKLTGCDMNFLLNYLEKQFKDGMTWQNYGGKIGCWSIEHKACCALFDLSLLNHQKACFHYSNLEPMWHLENITKQDKIGNDKRARDLTAEEKKAELIRLGFDYLFD
jgi:hypothetical protein